MFLLKFGLHFAALGTRVGHREGKVRILSQRKHFPQGEFRGFHLYLYSDLLQSTDIQKT